MSLFSHRMTTRTIACLPVVAVSLLTPSTLLAQSYTWTGNVNNNWDTTTANWASPSGSVWHNGDSSDALIGDGPTINLASHITANSIIFNGSRTISSAFSNLWLDGTASGIYVNAGHIATINARIVGTDGLYMSGSGGTLNLTAANAYTGATEVFTGQLNLMGAGQLVASSDVILHSHGTFSLAGVTQQIAGLRGDGAVTNLHTGNAQSNLLIAGNQTDPGDFFLGVVSDGPTALLSITKNSTGTQTFGGVSPNAYNGGTYVEAGILAAAKNSAFGGGLTTVFPGATVRLRGGVTQPNSFSLDGQGALSSAGAIDNMGGNNTISGPIFLIRGSTIGSTFDNLTLANVAGLGHIPTFNPLAGATIRVQRINTSFGAVKEGAGTLFLNGGAQFFGPVVINNGVVALESTAALNGNPITMSASQPATLRLNGFSSTIPSLTGGSSSTVENGADSSAFLTFDVNAGTQTFAGTLSNGAGLGTLGLTKTGTGTLVLSGANTYTGLTTIQDGTINGITNFVGSVTLNGGSLGGFRTIGGTLTVNNGAVQPGTGQITAANGFTATGGSIEMTGPGPVSGFAQLRVTGGNIDLGAGSLSLVLTVTNTSGIFGPNDFIPVVVNSGAGSLSGYFASLPNNAEVTTLAGFGGQPHWYIYYNCDSTTGTIGAGNDVIVTPIPTMPIVVNGGFEVGSGSLGVLPVGSNAIDRWVVTRGSVDWFDGWQAADGSRSIDLQGINSTGGVQQMLATSVGARYRLTFSLAGNPDGGTPIKHMRVRADNEMSNIFEFDTTGRSHANMGWVERSFVFHAHGDITNIELYSTDPTSSWGAVIDNVRVVEEPCPSDFNSDGMSNSQDFFDFITAFFAGEPRADFNNDGVTNSQDFFDFITTFFAGC